MKLTKKQAAIIEDDYKKISELISKTIEKAKDVPANRRIVLKTLTGNRHMVSFRFQKNSINISYDNREAMITTVGQTNDAIAMCATAVFFAIMYGRTDVTNAVVDFIIKGIVKAVAQSVKQNG